MTPFPFILIINFGNKISVTVVFVYFCVEVLKRVNVNNKTLKIQRLLKFKFE